MDHTAHMPDVTRRRLLTYDAPVPRVVRADAHQLPFRESTFQMVVPYEKLMAIVR
jgi:ubiquinone/menaquinone biosynthesis C-methylase UbiE